MRLIALAGGIGAGKSVVSRILRAMGYIVYDTDSRARDIMDSSGAIKNFLLESITPEALYDDGTINRPAVAAVVFSDADKLALLNAAVHSAVRADMRACASQAASSGCDLMFVETAIAVSSGLAAEMDSVWEVYAPERLRVSRVCARGAGMSEAHALARIEAQREEEEALKSCRDVVIVNDGIEPVLPQIEAAIVSELRN